MVDHRPDASVDQPPDSVDQPPAPGEVSGAWSWPVYHGRTDPAVRRGAEPAADDLTELAAHRGAEPAADDLTHLIAEHATEPLSDFSGVGVPRSPNPVAVDRRRRWPWAAAVAGAGAVALVWVAIHGSPIPRSAERQAQEWPVAPAQWQRVDASLTDGLVIVAGATEADGLVLNRSGLVATSYTAVLGDPDAPSDGSWVRVAPDGQNSVPVTVVGADKAADILLLQATGFRPSSVVRPGPPVAVGETLTLLDDQGGRHSVIGVGVVVTATGQPCSRAGSDARPTGFRFTLKVATAEPGAALVRADGTVAGMYYGGDDAAHHCAIPIADVLTAAKAAR